MLREYSHNGRAVFRRTDAVLPRPSVVHASSVRNAVNAGRLVSCLALVAVLLITNACGTKSVTTVTTETDAIEILDVLGESGIEAEKREVGEGETKKWDVVVEDGLFGDGTRALAIQVLRDHGLPRPDETIAEEGGGFIPSDRVEKAREQKKIRTDIERQLRALPGVTRAIVTVVMPQDPSLELHPYPATASVVLTYQDEKPRFNEEQIQNIIARGVPSLKPTDVSVTMSQQALRPVPQHERNARRRNGILLAAGIGLITVLCILLIVLFLQSRRQRAELAELREANQILEEEGEPDAAEAELTAGAVAGRLERTGAGTSRGPAAGRLLAGTPTDGTP